MRARSSTLLLATGLGLVTGMRSMAGAAFLSRRLAGRRTRGPVSRLLGSGPAPWLLTAAAAGELVADKLPFVPPRTDPPALLGRGTLGALCGVAVAEMQRGSRLEGAVAGAAAALASTFVTYHLRKNAGAATGLPDPALAVAEDAVVLTAAAHLTDAVG